MKQKHRETYRNRTRLKAIRDFWNASVRRLKARAEAIRMIEELDRHYGDFLKGTAIR
jgi:hypothetical protein